MKVNRVRQIPLWIAFLNAVALIALTTREARAEQPQDALNQALITAVEQSDIPTIKAALAKGANPNSADKRFSKTRYALNIAVEPFAIEDSIIINRPAFEKSKKKYDAKRVSIVRALLDSGADPNIAEPRNGITPLITAVTSEFTDCVVLLLSKGAIVNKRSQSGAIALMYVQRYAFSNSAHARPAVYRALVKAGADVNASDVEGNTPLMIAAREKDPDFVQFLLSKGANVQALNRAGETALMNATPDLPIMKLLLKAGAQIDVNGDRGYRVLCRSINSLEVLKLLLSKGADVNGPPGTGYPIFVHAAYYQVDASVMKLLLASHADINATMGSGKEKGYSPLMAAVSIENVEAVKFLLANGADVNMKADNGQTALSLAEKTNNPEILRLLQDRAPH